MGWSCEGWFSPDKPHLAHSHSLSTIQITNFHSEGTCIQVRAFIEALKRDYFVRKLTADGEQPHDASLADHVFFTTPGHGAAIATKECIIAQ